MTDLLMQVEFVTHTVCIKIKNTYHLFHFSLQFSLPDTHFSSEVQYYIHILPSDLEQLLVELLMLLFFGFVLKM